MQDRAPDHRPEIGESAAVPPDHAQPLARSALARRKRRDAAIVLPFACMLLFASPLLDLVAGAGSVAGVPVSVLYIFGAWFALIWITARLAGPLMRDAGEG
jgi:hypothetical protein